MIETQTTIANRNFPILKPWCIPSIRTAFSAQHQITNIAILPFLLLKDLIPQALICLKLILALLTPLNHSIQVIQEALRPRYRVRPLRVDSDRIL